MRLGLRGLSTTTTPARKRLAILYGSQTGTAESYARMLGPQAVSHNFEPVIAPLNAAEDLLHQADAMACVVSTAGNGELPRNAERFYERLVRGDVVALRRGTPFAILGLGDSSHERFNAAAKALDKALTNAGGTSVQQVALSDDNNLIGGHDVTYREWKRGLWQSLGGSLTKGGAPTVVYECPRVRRSSKADQEEAPRVGTRLLDVEGFGRAAVEANEVVSATGYEPVSRKLRFSSLGKVDVADVEYVDVLPHNSRQLVERAAKRLDLDLGTVVDVVPLDGAPPTPEIDGQHLAIATLLAEVIDLSGIPARSFLEGLAAIATDADESAELDDLANDLSSTGDYDKLSARGFSLVDALERFPKVPLSLEYLLSYAPRITPRTYSLASDSNLELCYNDPVCFRDGDCIYRGLTTHMMAQLKPGDTFSVALRQEAPGGNPGGGNPGGGGQGQQERRGTPPHQKIKATVAEEGKPLCVVALGTGISSARALLQARRKQKHKFVHNVPMVDTVLYYGFRHSGKDDLFSDEFRGYVDEGWLEVKKTASDDQAAFVTPLDAMDSSLADFLGANGQVRYFGVGGDVPYYVELKLRQVGVDVASIKTNGRYREEAFSKDLDIDNLMARTMGRGLSSSSGEAAADDDAAAEKGETKKTTAAATLAGRVGRTEMWCFQCEQTFKGQGCRTVGVCGKTPRVAALQDLLVHKVKILGFYLHELEQDDPAANRLMLNALFATLTNVNFDESRFVDLVAQVHEATDRVKSQIFSSSDEKKDTSKKTLPPSVPEMSMIGELFSSSDLLSQSPADALVNLGREVNVLERFGHPRTQSSEGLREMLMYGLKGIAAYAAHSMVNHREDPEIYAFLRKALAYLAKESPQQPKDDDDDVAAALEMCLEAGKANVAAMALLYDSHATTLGVPSPHDVSLRPRPGRKAILVSGHDLILLRDLLEKTEPLEIDVYTHGEMLPAHSYPGLRKFGTLAGHFGGAWFRQSVEFPKFKGPVLVTTNCLTEPHDTYGDRLFTAGQVGWPGIRHLGDENTIDFEPLLRAAMDAPGFFEDADFDYADPLGQTRPKTLRVGYGHETIVKELAGTLINQVKKGTITRFYVVGGCDGFEGHRSYYTDLVKNLPPTSVVLTLGCGKYRVNHLAENLGTIGDTGVPRILDVGQCNDAYSAIQVASALAAALDCDDLSQLPLSIVLSWFEQKAIAVLLSCLHLGLKPIHIGPALPAFVTPDVLKVLTTDFGVVPIGDPLEDAYLMANATGAS
mmetsp:Transcript_31840/g.101948  ORF Transcript_31840/g.101948 Transcript_31840/m.101948 type:complete len:1255 (-) Transcript_31840:500-4264(-)